MDVSDILSLLATLSIGLDDPQDSDKAVFMRYINLCYFELLQSTLTQNPQVPITSEELDCIDGAVERTMQPIFIPKVVYDIASNLPLIGTTFDEVVQKDPGLTNNTGTALKWYYASGGINIYPNITSLKNQSGGIGIRYIKQPNPLTKDSPSKDILIPTIYQQVLADGAAYYLFQSETGFKDQVKMAAAMARWEQGKQNIFAYMKNIGGKKYFSTYSPV